jgi:hypothetical protein
LLGYTLVKLRLLSTFNPTWQLLAYTKTFSAKTETLSAKTETLSAKTGAKTGAKTAAGG